MPDKNPIYDFMKANGLTDKDETTFLREYSDSAKAREVFGFFQANKLTDKTFDDFYGTYLKKKGSLLSGVGGVALQNGSQGGSSLLNGGGGVKKVEYPDTLPENEWDRKRAEREKYFSESINQEEYKKDPLKTLNKAVFSEAIGKEINKKPISESTGQKYLSPEIKVNEENINVYNQRRLEDNLKENIFPTTQAARDWKFANGKGGVTDADNETDLLADKVINEHEKVKAILNLHRGDIKNAAIEYYANQDPRVAEIFKAGGTPPPETVGALVGNFLRDKNVLELTQESKEFNDAYREAQFNFRRDYPEMFTNEIVQKIAQGREDYGENNPFINLVGVNSSDRVIQRLYDEKKIDEEELEHYQKVVRPQLALHLKRIPTTGFVENAFQSAEKGLTDIPKGLYDLTGIHNAITTKADRAYDELSEEANYTHVTPKTFGGTIATATGHLGGLLLPLSAGTKALAASKIMNAKTANEVMMGLTFYHDLYKEAEKNNPNGGYLNQLQALVQTTIFAKINPTFGALSKGVVTKAAPQIKEVLEKLKTESITGSQAKEGIVQAILTQVPKKTLKTSGEMMLATGVSDAVGGIFSGKYDGEQSINNMVHTFESMLLGTPLLNLASVRSNRRVMEEYLSDMGDNPTRYREQITKLAETDPEIKKRLPELLQNLTHVEAVKKELDAREDIKPSEKKKYLLLSLQEKLLKEKADAIPDEGLKPEKQLKEIEIEKKMALDPDMGNQKIVEEFYNIEGLLPKGISERLEVDGKFSPAKVGGILKEIAQQANNLDENWKPISGEVKMTKPNVPDQLIEIANERWVKEIEKALPKEEPISDLGFNEETGEATSEAKAEQPSTGLSRGDVGEEMGGEKLPTIDEVYDILESEESRQGGSWLDNEYGDARFESEEQAKKYAEEVHSFLVGLGNEKEIPVYRAVSAEDVDLSPYGIGESWSFSLDAAKEFGRRLGVPLSKVKIISGEVPSENVDWQQAVRRYHNFSDSHSGESEFELPIPANRKIKNIQVHNFKEVKEIKNETEKSTSNENSSGGIRPDSGIENKDKGGNTEEKIGEREKTKTFIDQSLSSNTPKEQTTASKVAEQGELEAAKPKEEPTPDLGFNPETNEATSEAAGVSGSALKDVPQFAAKSDKHFEYVPIEEVDVYKEFDRETEKKFDKKELDDLIEDIRKNGIKKPIQIKVDRNGNALIVEGNTRLAAAKRLGIKNIPVEIVEGEFGSINKEKAKKLPDVGRGELQRRQQTELGLKDNNGAYSKGFTKVEAPTQYTEAAGEKPSGLKGNLQSKGFDAKPDGVYEKNGVRFTIENDKVYEVNNGEPSKYHANKIENSAIIENIENVGADKGVASKLLDEVIQAANEEGKELQLFPRPPKGGKLNKQQLTEWYERKGFVLREDGIMVKKPEKSYTEAAKPKASVPEDRSAGVGEAAMGGEPKIETENTEKTIQGIENQPPKPPEKPVGESGDGEGLPERRFTKQMLRDEDMLGKEEIAKTLNYVRQTNDMSVKEASEILNKVGVDEAKDLVINDVDIKPAVRVVLAQMVIKKYNELAKIASETESEAHRDFYLDKAIQTATFVTEKLATEPGQMIQAFSLWSRLSPEGQLRAANQDMAKQGKEKVRRREKDIKTIGDQFKKANEESANEVVESKEVKETVQKDTNEKIVKSKDKIAKIREKRAAIIKNAKNSRGNLYSVGRLTAEGVKFVGEIAKTYIEEGVANLEILVQKVVAHIEEVAGKRATDEIKKQIQEETDKTFDQADKSFLGKVLKDKNVRIAEIVKKHYTVVEKAKKSLAQKLMDDADMSQSNAQELAKKVEAAFDRIATRKKRNILYKEKARFEKIHNTLKDFKKPDPKTIQDEIIKYSNLGAFESGEFLDMVSEKFGVGKIQPDQAAKLMQLAEKVQNAAEGSPKNDATEDLLAYRAKLRGNDLGETAQAVWYANTLSGYKTHEKNLISTFFQSMGEIGTEMAKDPKAIPYLIAGYLNGTLRRGLTEAKHTLKTGRSPIHIKKVETPNVLERKQFKGGGYNPGNWFKYVMRFMVASDVLSFQGLKEARARQLARRIAGEEGFNTWSKKGWDRVNEILFHTKERWREAELQAEEEGLKGSAKKRRIYELMESSRPVEMTEDAYGFAAKGTFNHLSEGSLGALTNAIAGGLDAVSVGGVKPLRFIVPFTRIITNVVNNSLDYTPVGLVRAARGVRGFKAFEGNQVTKSAYKELSREERKRLIAKAAIGITLTATLQALHMAGAITITGAGPDDPEKKRQLMQEGWQPYSIKIGNRWYSYQYTPLVFMTGFLGNMNDAGEYAKEGTNPDFWKKMEVASSRVASQVVDMTWINSAATFLGALSESNPASQEKKLSQAFAGMTRGAVPFGGAINQTSQAVQSIWGMPQKQANNAWQALIADIPIARNSLNDKINALGDPVVRDIDVVTSKETTDPVWKYLLDHKGWVAPVNKGTIIIYDKDKNIERPVTDDEYYEFSKMRGQEIKKGIKMIMDSQQIPVIRDGQVEQVSGKDLKEGELNQILSKLESMATKYTKSMLFNKPEANEEKEESVKEYNKMVKELLGELELEVENE